MLACLQRRQNPAEQRPLCAARTPEALPPSSQKCEPTAMPQRQRYPSPAELDAYAQKTSDSPLSIKIFPPNVRVPQQKHLNRTVNGFDTSGLRYSPYTQLPTGTYKGLLAIATATLTSSAKGLVKSADGRRTKPSPAQIAVAPYPPPGGGALAHRHRQMAYHAGVPQPQTEGSSVPATAPVIPVAGGRALALGPQPNLPSIQSLIYQINQHCQSQAPVQAPQQVAPGFLLRAGATATSPSVQATAVAACPSTASSRCFSVGTAPQDSLGGYSGAVLPAQSTEVAKAGAYVDSGDYVLWQQKQQQQQQQQHHQQVALQMYSAGSGGGGAISRSPETSILGAGTRPYPLSGVDRLSSSPLNCAAMHSNFSVGQHFAPPWNSVLATPDSDCYNPQELPGASTGGDRDQVQRLHPTTMDCGGGFCYPLPAKALGAGSALGSSSSSSLRSLEFLISGIHPPCIKEQMLGKGYEAVSVPRLLDHQHAHVRLPVYR